MKIKANIFKALKALFIFAGFPLMIMLMIIVMAPSFDAEVTGNFAQNWIVAFTAIWVALLIIYFLLEKFIGAKSKTHHRVVLVVMSALSILCILLPPACYDAVLRPKYQAAQEQLVGEVNIKDYDAVAGWHRDFTKRYDSEVYDLINQNYDFMKLYGLDHTYSKWYDNADKENGLGYKYGSFEKAKILTEQKLQAKHNLELAQAELAEIEAGIQEKLDAVNAAQEALDADPANVELQNALAQAQSAYNAEVADKEDDLVRLKGARVDISAYKEQLVNLVIDVVQNLNTVLPDGLTIEIAGLELPIGDLLSNDMIAGIINGVLTPDMLNGLIPDVIYTGIGEQTVSTYQKAVDGFDSDVSLATAQELNFKYEYYPAVLAVGAVRHISYICVGIVVLCIFLADYFNDKQKDAEKQLKEEAAQND